jgi:hypothetical protein
LFRHINAAMLYPHWLEHSTAGYINHILFSLVERFEHDLNAVENAVVRSPPLVDASLSRGGGGYAYTSDST